MKVYSIHVRRMPAPELISVKEGFSWPAFLFSFLWAFWHRLWLVGLGFVFLQAAVAGLLLVVHFDEVGHAALNLGAAVLTGAIANDGRRWTLARRGFADADVVAADGTERAERDFLRARPDFAADLMRLHR